MSLFDTVCHCLSLFVTVCHCVSLFVIVCQYLSLFVTICHCLSLFVTVCHCLSLFVTVCHCLSLFITPPLFNSCRKGKEPIFRVKSHQGLHSCRLQPCLKICFTFQLYAMNGIAHLCLIPTLAYRGQLWKGHQKKIFMTKIVSIHSCLLFEPISSLQKYISLDETKVSVINWHNWHYKLKFLFCGALYNQWKCIKVLFHYCRNIFLKQAPRGQCFKNICSCN